MQYTEVFTNNFGKVSGIVYGGTSRKIKNYLQLSNKIYVNYISKNDNKIGYFKTELIEVVAPKYFSEKNKILCLNSITSMLKVLLPENQQYKNIYNSLNNLLKFLNNQSWLIDYVNWELNLISNLGFGFDTKKFTNNASKNLNLEIDNMQYKVPIFLLTKKVENISKQDLYEGLFFCRRLWK